MKPKTYLAIAVAIVALGSFPFLADAQGVTAEGRKSDEILGKMHKLDMINQILPVLMTTTQVKKILPGVEAARQAERKLMSQEAALLRKLEPTLDAAIKEAIDKRKIVPRETMIEAAKSTQAMMIGRRTLETEHVDKVTKLVEDTLDEGQKKAISNSLSLSTYFPGKKSEDVPQATRVRTWVKYVLLDEQSYEILVSLSRKAD